MTIERDQAALETFLQGQETGHEHIDGATARAIYRVARGGIEDMGDLSLRLQKVIYGCGMCTTVTVESSPTFYAHAGGERYDFGQSR